MKIAIHWIKHYKQKFWIQLWIVITIRPPEILNKRPQHTLMIFLHSVFTILLRQLYVCFFFNLFFFFDYTKYCITTRLFTVANIKTQTELWESLNKQEKYTSISNHKAWDNKNLRNLFSTHTINLKEKKFHKKQCFFKVLNED